MRSNAMHGQSVGEIVAGLARIDFFAGLDEKTLRTIAERTHVRRFDSGQSLCRYNDESRDVFMILEGIARATIFSPNGREVAFRDLRAGDSFGELAAIDPQPRSANVITQCPSLVALVSATDFLDIMRRHPQVAENTMRKLARWVRSLSERVYEFNAPVAVRICSEVMRLARESMISDNIARLRPAPKHAEIAARVNTHREAVTRTFGDLKKAGIIKRGRGELLVTDVGGLARHLRMLETDDG
ncbi:MAG: Crp/Fnr family transcriptional regulator [Geminicoccaceae bacterium]